MIDLCKQEKQWLTEIYDLKYQKLFCKKKETQFPRLFFSDEKILIKGLFVSLCRIKES